MYSCIHKRRRIEFQASANNTIRYVWTYIITQIVTFYFLYCVMVDTVVR